MLEKETPFHVPSLYYFGCLHSTVYRCEVVFICSMYLEKKAGIRGRVLFKVSLLFCGNNQQSTDVSALNYLLTMTSNREDDTLLSDLPSSSHGVLL